MAIRLARGWETAKLNFLGLATGPSALLLPWEPASAMRATTPRNNDGCSSRIVRLR